MQIKKSFRQLNSAQVNDFVTKMLLKLRRNGTCLRI